MQDRADVEEIQQAILQERLRREYHVVVENVRESYGIAGIAIPRGLEAYVATTTCTESHATGPCIWSDFAFCIKGHIHVLLQNDLICPGMTLEESARLLLSRLQRRDTEEIRWQKERHNSINQDQEG